MTLFEQFLTSPFQLSMYFLSVAFAVFGIFLAANHTWTDKQGKTLGLILWTTNNFIKKIAAKFDTLFVVSMIRAVSIFTVVGLVVAVSIFKTVQTGDLNYLFILTLLVGLLALPKNYTYLSDMILNCYRCMPTFWVGLPLVAWSLWNGFVIDTVYFSNLPFIVFAIGFVSTCTTLLWMVYTSLFKIIGSYDEPDTLNEMIEKETKLRAKIIEFKKHLDENPIDVDGLRNLITDRGRYEVIELANQQKGE